MIDSRWRWEFFIAHAGPDAAIANELYNLLEQYARTYLDGYSLVLGDDWDQKLPQAQRETRITVVLVSRNTEEAYYQREEIRNAIAMARKNDGLHRLIPVYLEDLADEEIPYGLRLKHSLWLTKVGGIQGVADALLKALEQLRALDVPILEIDKLAKPASDAIQILAACFEGLPLEVVSQVAGLDKNCLQKSIGPALETDYLAKGIAKLHRELPRKVVRNDSVDLMAATLAALLGYIEEHKSDGIGKPYAKTAVELAHTCKNQRRDAVRNIFDALEKILKRQGNKKLVLEVADLAIDAAERDHRTTEEVHIEAKARICGRSWVFQRIGRLAEARVEAERSLKLGEQVGWARNTAYCQKCLGRLYRIEADHATDDQQKQAFLKLSIDCLNDATTRFMKHPEFGPTNSEVGECHSLRGRTLLVAGQLRDAEQAIKKAEKLLTDETSKDYVDFLILKGDLCAAQGSLDSAVSYYEEVLALQAGDDSEKSEIQARARFRRGLARAKQGRKSDAAADFNLSGKTWEDLGERLATAEARWEGILLENFLLPRSIKRLEKASATTRVIAARIHKKRLEAAPVRGPRRSEPSSAYWDQILQESEQIDAKQDIEW